VRVPHSVERTTISQSGNSQDLQNCQDKQTHLPRGFAAPGHPASSVNPVKSGITAISLHSDAGLLKSAQHAPQCLPQTGTLAIQ